MYLSANIYIFYRYAKRQKASSCNYHRFPYRGKVTLTSESPFKSPYSPYI